MFSFTKAEMAFKYYTSGKHKANIQIFSFMKESNSLISQEQKLQIDHSFHTLTWKTHTSPPFYPLTSSVIPNVTTSENHIYSILRAAIRCTKIMIFFL